ncbi:hypothetical protein BDZ45DRAFT_553210, partial [Acephala macrosclerotiorum]
LDIVAVHGLTGDAYNTWTDKDTKVLWLRDILPTRLPEARIWSFGYSADVYKSLGTGNFDDFARALLESLRGRRFLPLKRKIIFICHSMGGLVVKKALILASGPDRDRFGNIHESTFGIMFLATPHRGSEAVGLPMVLSKILDL